MPCDTLASSYSCVYVYALYSEKRVCSMNHCGRCRLPALLINKPGYIPQPGCAAMVKLAGWLARGRRVLDAAMELPAKFSTSAVAVLITSKHEATVVCAQ